nr:uncharacterized protein CFP56_78129 [Quercus suber]
MIARSATFTHISFWVQVWGLPFDLIHEDAGWDIAKGLGKVIEVDSKALDSEQARFIRIRLEIPLDKPLHRGSYVADPEGEQVRIGFKYERLVGLCFQCEKLGHKMKECSRPRDASLVENPYGEWLKVGFRRKDDNPNRRPP